MAVNSQVWGLDGTGVLPVQPYRTNCNIRLRCAALVSLLLFPPKSLNHTTLKVAENTLSFYADISNRKWPHAMELNVLVIGLSNVMLVSRLSESMHSVIKGIKGRELDIHLDFGFFKPS